MKKRPVKKTRIALFIFALFCLIILLIAYKPIILLWSTKKNDKNTLLPLAKGFADDVSRLNKTKIDSSVDISADYPSAITQLTSLIDYAAKNKLPISIAGASHSMGGHTIAPDGIRINMLPFNKLSLDTITGILTVGSGALWANVIPYLNQHGRAVAIMQSNNAFSVGGSISVNCHGWQHNRAPISSSVLSFKLMNAKGEVVKCSRTENQELFSLTLGGYGLFGIILEVDLQTVQNETYSYHRILTASDKYQEYYKERIDDNKKVRMVYGRLNINKEQFLEKAILNYFELEGTAKKNAPLSDSRFEEFKRSIFLSSKDDDYGKKLRWTSERVFSKAVVGMTFHRNQIMNESPSFFLNRSASKTDILHEYFIPRKNFNLFVKRLQAIIPKHKVDLINVTIRNVYKDEDTFLNYAREEMFAFVMFFNQSIDKDAEKEMAELTRELIDASIDLQGTFYLPYRLHATKEQLLMGYPQVKDFLRKKLEHDPLEVFQNKLYMEYKEISIE